MSTDNRVNHKRKCKHLPDHDPNYPNRDYYERQERRAQGETTVDKPTSPTSDDLFRGPDEAFPLQPPSWQRYDPVPVALAQQAAQA